MEKPTRSADDERYLSDSEIARTVTRISENDPTLTEVRLNCESIDDAVAKGIAASLVHNTVLRTLCLCHDHFSVRIGDAGAEALAEMLCTNDTLETLDLGSNGIYRDGANAIAESLKRNAALRNLYLDVNYVGDVGAISIAESLRSNETLESLSLENNEFGDAGAEAIADSLCRNDTLAILDLSVNRIGDGGAEAIATALRRNSTIKELDLSYTSIGDRGAAAIARSLRHNTSLKVLRLWPNGNIGKEGTAAIAASLRHNHHVLDLGLRHDHPIFGLRHLIDCGDCCLTIHQYLKLNRAGPLASEIRKNGRVVNGILEDDVPGPLFPEALAAVMKLGNGKLGILYSFVREKHPLLLNFY